MQTSWFKHFPKVEEPVCCRISEHNDCWVINLHLHIASCGFRQAELERLKDELRASPNDQVSLEVCSL